MSTLKLRIPKADLPFFPDYVFRLPERFPPETSEWVDVELVSELEPRTMWHECKLYLAPNVYTLATERKLIGECSTANKLFTNDDGKAEIVRLMIEYVTRGYRANK
jgi:hypothetical protein